MAEKEPMDADEILRQVPGFYDHSKVRAYQSCIIELAKCGDVNLLEMMVALRNVLLATETQLAKKAGDLKVPESIRKLAEEAEGVAEEVASVPTPEGNPESATEGNPKEAPEEKPEVSAAGKSAGKATTKRARKSPARSRKKPEGKSEGDPEGKKQ